MLEFNAQDSRTVPESVAKIPDSLSAVLLTPEQHLWLGCDETCTLERLTLDGNGNFSNHQHFILTDYLDLPAGDEHEVDIEGLDYDPPYLWIVGSHSRKRKKARSERTDAENLTRLATVDSEANRYLLARIPLVDGKLHRTYTGGETTLTAACLETTPEGNLLIAALSNDEHLGPFIQAQIPGKDNGFDIEGLVVSQGRVFIGLRGPVLRGWAMLLELKLKEVTPKRLKLSKFGPEAQRYQKYFLNLGGLGIRDLQRQGEDMLVLAGPTMGLDGPVTLFRLPQFFQAPSEFYWQPQSMLDLPYGHGNDHAEGVTLAQSLTGKPALLVVYDAPSPQRRPTANRVVADLFPLPEP